MKKKQMLAMLLAALMTLSVPLVAFAEGEPTDPNTANLIQPCIADDKAPVLKSITLSSETVNAGDTLTITVDAEDDLSGIKECYVSFENKNTKKSLHVSHFMAGSKELTLEIPKYEPNGKYDLTVVCLEDNTGNVVWYAKDTNMNLEVKPLPFDLSFTVTNSSKADTKAPELTGIQLDKEIVNAGDTLTITVDAEDDLSGIKECYVSFENKNTKKSLHVSHFMAGSKELTLKIPKYEPDGKYDLTVVCLEDNTGNVVWYAKDTNMNLEVKLLPYDISFTVINDGSVPTPPTNPDKPVTPPTDPDKPVTPPTNPDKPVTPPASEQKPFQPSYSTGSSASGNSVTSVKSAPAASGSSIKQEEKDRLFWKNKQDQIRKAANGKKIRIFIPKETTRVPASFLESIRTAENDITVELRWNGKKITITPETALKRSVRRVFWNLKTLLEYYHA